MRVVIPPSVDEIFQHTAGERLVELFMLDSSGFVRGEYLHWDKLRHKKPPEALTLEEWWLLIKQARQPLLRPIPLADTVGMSFQYAMPDVVLRDLHYIDQHTSGEIAMPEIVVGDQQSKRHYLINSLMEEAIRSSQLEGATTSRTVAKDLLRSGRTPRDRSERMIVNNFRALNFMRDEMGDSLSPGLVLELHRILTEGTLDDPSAAGRLQSLEDDRVAVFDRVDGRVVHRPPPASELPERLERLCAFANTGEDPDEFMHPVLRAILLHFWLAYDHPFEDGNGRTARTLFYWSMRRSKYWLTEFLSISGILRKAPPQYGKAFLLTETDDRDTTYFIVYQLGVIRRAIDELFAQLREKVEEVREVEKLIRADSFNHRQLALLGDAIRTPGHAYTFTSHATSHNVTHETARTDLLDLFGRGLLERSRVGRQHTFRPVPDIAEKLRDG